MTAAVRCPSHSPVEICAVLGFNSDRDGLVVINGCGYCDDSGQCRYRGRIRHAPQPHMADAARKEHREPGVPEYHKERKEHRKEQRRLGQVSLHAFLGRC